MRVLWLLALALAACGAGEEYGADGAGGSPAYADAGTVSTGCLSSNECPSGYICNDFGRCEMPPPPSSDAGVPPPPEVEYEVGGPISSQRFVYVPMPDQDELVRIDGVTLAVSSTHVGDQPREVATIPGSDGAVVLDSTNGTATIVRPAGDGDTTKVLPTLQRLNRLDIDPSGRFAVIWFDLRKAINSGTASGIGSFQDVTVVRLAQGNEKAVNLTVGFRPSEVQFDAAGDRAYVITEDGVSVIHLGFATDNQATIVPPIPVVDPSGPTDDVEVDVVATGEYAAVRQGQLPSLRIVNVGSDPGASSTIQLASPATDIDLAPDGTRIYAVEREAKQLAIIAVPSGTVETIDLANATLGSLVLSRDGTRGLLYTNATSDERVTLVALDQPGFPTMTWPVKKSLRAVGISPAGSTAILLHAKAFGDPTSASDFDDFVDKSYGYTLLDLATGFGKLQITPVDPGAFSYSPDGSKVYVGLDGGDQPTATRALQVVTAQTGVVITKQLGSPPEQIGILPAAAQAFVAQRHPLGRVSFVSLANDAMRTVTGFDLNGNVVP
jgi:hypothetical protein